MVRTQASAWRRPLTPVVWAVMVTAGCNSGLTDDDDREATTAEAYSAGDDSAVAADCPSADEFQTVCACDAAELSWEELRLPADQPYSQLVTAFVEGSAESVAAAACTGALGREDIVATDVHELSGRTDGSTTVGVNLESKDGLVGYSLLSDDRGVPLGYAYFVVGRGAEGLTVNLTPWGERDASTE